MRSRPVVGLVMIYCLFLVLVLVMVPEWGESIFRWNLQEAQIQKQYGGKNRIVGLVTARQQKEEEGRLRLKLQDGNECIVILSNEELSKIHMGSRVQVSGEIWWPEAATNPGQWDGIQYARMHHIAFYMRSVKTVVMQEADSVWYTCIGSLQETISEMIDQKWQHPWNTIVKAMVLGDRSEVSEETSQLFRQGGISHVIAISGLHLTILGDMLSAFLRRFQKPKLVQGEVTALIWAYVLFTGAAISTLRAAIMMTIRSAAVLFDREEDFPTTICLAAGILLLYEPLYLLDAGFCLSFAAVLGLRYGKGWGMLFTGIPYRIRRYLASSVGVSLTTIPLSLWFFYETSPWSFVLNFWVVPAMNFLFMSILAALGVSVLYPALGVGFVKTAEFLLWTFQKGSEGIAALPFARWTGQPKLGELMCYYLILLLFFLYYRKQAQLCRRVTALVCVSVLNGILWISKPTWRVMYLDIGQGDCAVIEWNRKAFVLDAGPSYETILKPYLKQRGIEEIDGLILSHPDWDHIEGLLALSTDPDFHVKGLWIADAASQNTEMRNQVEQAVERQGGWIRKVKAGYQLKQDGFMLRVLAPEKELGDSNDDSLVVQIEIEGTVFLFTGDLGTAAEQQYSQQWEAVDVLKIAHHGSRYSSSEGFLKSTQPKLAVISCGRDNRYGHPHEETLMRLEDQQIVWVSTAESGAVWIEPQANSWNFSSFMRHKQEKEAVN